MSLLKSRHSFRPAHSRLAASTAANGAVHSNAPISWHGVALALAGAMLLAVGACADPTATRDAANVPAAPNRYVVSVSDKYSQADAGALHTCATRIDRTVACWGFNDFGETDVPVGLTGVSQVVAGFYHSCALKTDKTVACWGFNDDGETDVPTGLGDVESIAASGLHTCARKGDGTVTCWGDNSGGQLNVPSGLTGVTQISAGIDDNCATKNDGTVVCWGRNDWGELTVPPGLSAATQVGTGRYLSCALHSDGTVTCWGKNPNAPTDPPAGLNGAVQVSVGGGHACALRTDRTVVCWGINTAGQLDLPPGLAEVTQVSADDVITCALKADGALACWGYDGYGQATVPSTTTHLLPSATFVAPNSAMLNQQVTLTLSNAQVAGYPNVTFTYGFDCGDGQGYRAASSSSSATCTPSSIGARTVRGKVIDQDGDVAEYSSVVTVRYAFVGFAQPVDGNGTLNVAKAGRAIPLKWRLTDAGGAPVTTLATVSVKVVSLSCALGTTTDALEEYAAGSSGLQNLGNGYYQYNWATPSTYANSCKTLQLDMGDGTPRTALFQFTR